MPAIEDGPNGHDGPQSSPSPPAIPGYELIRRIGGGGYGDVWLARHSTGAWRAVKIVWRSRFTSERPYAREYEGIQNFEPVSRSYDSQVSILHVGSSEEEGCFYYIMELADDMLGRHEIDPAQYVPKTLHHVIGQRKRLPVSECISLGVTLCTALQHLHEAGLIHRDIKPSNIIFVQDRAKLADIGLVAALDESISFVGTAGFVAPEGPGSIRADIFSLGRVLYEAFSGRTQGEFPQLATALGSDEDPLLAHELNLIVLKACAHDPLQRHGSALALQRELLLLQSGQSISRLRQAERRAVIFGRAGIAAGIVAVFALVGFFSARSANKRASRELIEARLEQARSRWLTGEAGRREIGLAAIREAARIQPSMRLRDEAIAALSLTDLGKPSVFLPHPAEALELVRHEPERSVISPHFDRVAWCCRDGTVLIASWPDGKELFRLPATPDTRTPQGLQWSPDQRWLAVNYRGQTGIWDLAGRRMLTSIPAEAPGVTGRSISFSGDGTLFAVADGNRARVCKLPSCEVFKTIPGFQNEDNIDSVALNPVYPWIAWCANKKAIVQKLEPQEILQGYPLQTTARALRWSANGRHLAAPLRDNTLLVIDAFSRNRRTLTGHSDRVIQALLSPDGSLAASWSRDGNTRLWDAVAGGPSLASEYEGRAMAFSPDGKQLAFNSTEGVGIWPIIPSTPACTTLSGRINFDILEHLDFSPDGRWMASCSEGPDGIWLWNVAERKLVTEGVRDEKRRQWIGFASSSRLVSCGSDGICVWPIESQDHPPRLGTPTKVPLPGDSVACNVACLSADGRKLLARIRPGRAVVVDVATATASAPIDVAVGEITDPANGRSDAGIGSVAFSPDASRFAVGTRAMRGTFLYETATGRQIQQLASGDANVAFSPDGRWLAIFSALQCDFIDPHTLKVAKSLQRERVEKTPGSVAFSACGRYVACLTQRDHAALLDARTLQTLATIRLPDRAGATDLRFSRDGDHLIMHDKVRAHLYHIPSLRAELAKLGLDWK